MLSQLEPPSPPSPRTISPPFGGSIAPQNLPNPTAMMMQKPSRRGYTAPQGRVVRNCWKPICPIFNIIRFPFSSYPGRVILIWWFFELCDTKVPGFVWFSGGACSDYIPGWIYVYGGGPLCWVIGWIDCGSGLLIISLLLIISGLLIISRHVGGLYYQVQSYAPLAPLQLNRSIEH